MECGNPVLDFAVHDCIMDGLGHFGGGGFGIPDWAAYCRWHMNLDMSGMVRDYPKAAFPAVGGSAAAALWQVLMVIANQELKKKY